MKLTKFEKYFWDTVKFLEENNAKYMLHGSTLLRIIRDKTVIPRKDVLNDKELNFAMLAEDVSEEFENKLSEFPCFEPDTEAKYPNHLLYFGPFAIKNKDGSYFADIWETEFFTLLAKFWKRGNKRIEYMGSAEHLLFPAEMFEKPSKIKFKGHTFYTPRGPKEYLKYYFGKDYMTEKKTWHWNIAKCRNSYFKDGRR